MASLYELESPESLRPCVLLVHTVQIVSPAQDGALASFLYILLRWRSVSRVEVSVLDLGVLDKSM